MKKLVGTVALIVLVLSVSGYVMLSGEKNEAPKHNQDYLIKIETSKGDMYAVLYEETPKHRANFIKLIKGHYYDDLLFHRVIPDFMIQGGDPDSKEASKNANLGSGGPGYTIPAEIGKYHFKGTLAAARLGGPSNPKKASSGSQFYVTQGKVYDSLAISRLAAQKKQSAINELFRVYMVDPENASFMAQVKNLQQSGNQTGLDSLYATIEPILDAEYEKSGGVTYSAADIEKYGTAGGVPFLDGDYTVFGEVVKGLEVVDVIVAVKRNQVDRPKENVIMKITYEILSKKEITKRTGYQYK